jgi:hypothetical protein
MYPISKETITDYLNQSLIKIDNSFSIDELNRLKYAVNNPSFEWSNENKNILNNAIDSRILLVNSI